MIGFKKTVEFMTDKFCVLPSFPLGYETARRNLDYWTSIEYLMKIDQEKLEVLADEPSNECLSLLQLTFFNTISMFKELTCGWKKERDNNNQSGPTIEEVD